uniref:Uncharacterized protein n=1 Tax=Tetranychus urticae TaxID=32264 RepID=T1KEI4_TETUR
MINILLLYHTQYHDEPAFLKTLNFTRRFGWLTVT